jgi:hypothetical protein
MEKQKMMLDRSACGPNDDYYFASIPASVCTTVAGENLNGQ